jgi:large subunit ribosomal protein L29
VASLEAVELRARTDEELEGQLEDAHHALFNLRFQASTRQLADVKQVSQARRQVARIKTLMRERAILAEADATNLTGKAEAADATEAADTASEEE